MSVPPIGPSSFQSPSDSNMDLAKIYINELNSCMSAVPPNQQNYEEIKQKLTALLPSLSFPYNQFIQHGILYQCDAYFNPGNPLFSCNTNPDVQQGICCSLTSAFSLFTDGSLPTIPSSQLAALQTALNQFKNDILANNQQACSKDAATLSNLAGQLPEPYAALVTSMTVQYPNIFNPPDHDANFYVGMTTGLINAANYLTAPDYSQQGPAAWGDFEESIHVYGDDESAAADVETLGAGFNSATWAFNQVYDVTEGGQWQLAVPPNVDLDNQPGGPLDWLHDLTVFLSQARDGGTIPSSIFQGLSQQDQTIISNFLDGTGPFAQSGSGENMKTNWNIQDGYGKAGCDYYAQFATNGTFTQLTQATVDLMNAYLKTQ